MDAAAAVTAALDGVWVVVVTEEEMTVVVVLNEDTRVLDEDIKELAVIDVTELEDDKLEEVLGVTELETLKPFAPA